MALRILKPPVVPPDLAEQLAAELPPPVAVVAMGSPWRGDDAAAIFVARDLVAPPPHRLFNVESDASDPCDGLLVVIEAEGKRAALMVDELVGQQQVVIKALGEGLGKVRGVSGGTILGDGRVGLILDPVGILKLAGGNRDSVPRRGPGVVVRQALETAVEVG